MANVENFSDGELIAMYSEPYHRLEVYCSLFQVQLLDVTCLRYTAVHCHVTTLYMYMHIKHAYMMVLYKVIANCL